MKFSAVLSETSQQNPRGEFVAPSVVTAHECENAQVWIPAVVHVHVRVCMCVFVHVPPMPGVLMKESNWISWAGAGAFRSGRGRPRPPEGRGDEGDRPAGWITTVPLPLPLCLPKVGDYGLHVQ